LQRDILRIKIFIEMANSDDDSLDHGPETLAGLWQDVPVKGDHQHHHVVGQVLNFVVRLCINL
jgi:hypothetical protein